MRKVNIGLIIALVIFIALNVFQFVFWKNTNEQSAALFTNEIATLNSTISSFGDEVAVYTVVDAVKPGDEITEESITTMKMYTSLVTDQFVTDPEALIGHFYKIGINPGTPLLFNMIMDEELDDTARDRDIVLDRITVGIQVGDYIDIRMTMPYGDDYVVVPHKRVYGINDGTVKVYMNELEWNLYQGAMVDYFLNVEYGCSIYADRYVEPGLQQEAVNYYAVPTNIAALLQKNPNIVDKESAASLNTWRQSIEELLVIFRDEEDTVDADGSRLASGRAAFNEAVTADRQATEEERQQAEEEAAAEEEMEDEFGDDYWDDTPTDVPAEGEAPTDGDGTSTDGEGEVAE